MYSSVFPEQLNAPVLVASLKGWVDAAGVGTTVAEHLALDSTVVAEFDGDQLFDYRSSRPLVDFVDGHLRSMVWPALRVVHARFDDRDLLILHGEEPDLQWRAFRSAIADIAQETKCSEFLAIGSVPAAVPHTRPSPMMMTSPDSALLDGKISAPEGLLRVPGAALTVISDEIHGRNIPARGYWVQVPQYVNGPFFAGAVALLDHLAAHLDVTIPMGTLREDAANQLRQLDEVVEARPEARQLVDRLEELAAQGQEIPSAEEIGSQVEEFLRAEDGEDPFGPGSQ